MYTGCVDSLYRGRRGPPYRIGNAGPFGTSRYEANLYIVEPPLDPVLPPESDRSIGGRAIDRRHISRFCQGL